MNWPFWCVLGWGCFGVCLVCLIAVSSYAILNQRLVWKAWRREEEWAQEYERMCNWKSAVKPAKAPHGRN